MSKNLPAVRRAAGRVIDRLREASRPDPGPPLGSLAFSQPPVATGSEVQECLNLGCGNDYVASTSERRWINADISQNVKADVYFDAFETPYPFESDTFDLIKAYDFVEHIPHTLFDRQQKPLKQDGFFVLFDEFWRILKAGGVIECRFPAFQHPNNYIDPTHCRQLLRESFEWYLTAGGKYSFYANRHWELVSYDASQPDNHFVRLRKPTGGAPEGSG